MTLLKRSRRRRWLGRARSRFADEIATDKHAVPTAIASARRNGQAEGQICKLKLLNLTKRIEDLLTITKLITVFEVLDSEADGVKSFA